MARLAYRWLLIAFPAASRDRIGADLVDTLIADTRAESGWKSIGRFFANAVDLVSSGIAERRGGGQPTSQLPPDWREKSHPLAEVRRMASDAVVALRSFRKTPGFTLVAVLSIALGIGLNTTIFSLVNALLLRPVPGAEPSRLVTIFTSEDNDDPMSSSSYPDYADLARANTTLDGLMAHTLMFAGIERGDVTNITVGELVSSNYFDVLGVPLAAGRAFTPDADRPSAPPTAVLSHRMWQRDFGGRADAIGQTLTIHGRRFTITGIAPAGFNGFTAGISAELFLPVGAVDDVEPVGRINSTPSPTGTHRNEKRGQRYLFLTGRLKPGVSVDGAKANLDAVMAGLEKEYPLSNKNRRLTVISANAVRVLPDVDSALGASAAVLMGAVGLVLLVACSNIASLLLARATARTREMALRVAIGASRGRIIRQLIVESLVLSAIGGASGLLLATWLARILGRFQPPMQIAIAFDFTPDLRVFMFAFALALATGVLFGLAPAIRSSRPDLVPALKGESGVTRNPRFSLRSLLIVGQMALSTVLLVAAALLLRSFVAASAMDVKFDASHVVYAAINSGKQFATPEAARSFFDTAARQLSAMPGVTSVARSDRLPFALTGNSRVVKIDGVRGPNADGGTSVAVANVSSHYFETMGIRIVSGRAIDDRDRGSDSEPVAVINQAAARKFWPHTNPVGQHFTVTNEYTVVGISADHPVVSVGETPRPFFQFALDQTQSGFVNIIVRSEGSARALTPAVRRTLLGIDPTLAFMGLEPMTGMIDTTLFPARAATVLLGAFGGLALVLAVIGLYGVVSFTVARQTRDIGIRMALGADRGRVVGDVLARSFTLVSSGALVGLALSAAAAQVLSGFLVGVSSFDPLSYTAALVVLGAAALVATIVPARRAASINPIEALRTN
jgi:macrolide transport system ATP-binding/permease protein